MMATLCGLALLATGTGMVSIIIWTVEQRLIGVLEYPEKGLISICLSSATALISARAICSENLFFRILQSLSFWMSLVIGLGTMLTKTAVSIISADNDIHQWLLICVWAGGLLLALAGSGRSFGIKSRCDLTRDSCASDEPTSARE
jgi:hypothetical protein